MCLELAPVCLQQTCVRNKGEVSLPERHDGTITPVQADIVELYVQTESICCYGPMGLHADSGVKVLQRKSNDDGKMDLERGKEKMWG